MTPISLGIHGGAGRLGRRILALALEDTRFSLRGVIVRKGSAALGQDAGVLAGAKPMGLLATADARTLLHCDVVIDVSSPAAGAELAGLLAKGGAKALVTGTTGWTDVQDQALRQAAKDMAILLSGNFSLGVTALVHQVQEAAARLGPAWGVHIHDRHHSAKKDVPSGTALMLADAVMMGWDQSVTPKCLSLGRPLEEHPTRGEIIITADRVGEVVGTHNVMFYGAGETLCFTHTAQSRDIFAQGALHAAHWLYDKPPGLYGMEDVLS
ncbi:MAG: 4-hydroxy-tetrahydrodipicolinate reductase [Robiginitomaculum sp.]|nr:MAG: 4-hydroxy-tetrahydrodipicolinate reductase [Robiginitomaculum sp.]